MPLKTFTPIVKPSPGTSHAPKLKILKAEFGDGYSQPTPDGINHIRNTVSLKWDGLLYEQMESIWRFLVEHGGTRAFYYRPFGDGSMGKWTCEDFNRSADEGLWKMTATLEQSFTHQV